MRGTDVNKQRRKEKGMKENLEDRRKEGGRAKVDILYIVRIICVSLSLIYVYIYIYVYAH